MNAVLKMRRPSLGAEELLELGQVTRTSAAPALAPAAPAPAAPAAATKVVSLSREEGNLLIQVTENIVAFAKSFPIEFNSYCPPDRWQKALTQAGTWTHEIERQINSGSQFVTIPAESVFRLMDLEKCISAARDARLSAAKLAFTFSAVGAIADVVFGLSWIGVPAYIAGLAVLFGRPLMAKLNPEPQEPYKPAIAGSRGCAPRFTLGDHTDKRKFLERVIVASGVPVQRHHWGEVRPAFGPVQSSVCLAKDKFRVRVEGWLGDTIIVNEGWQRAPIGDCETNKQLVVWSPCGAEPRRTSNGPIPKDSGHPDTYWIEYVGPLTGGICRMAGPFG